MKKKLLFVMMHLHMGGAERSLVNLLSEINYNQYEVDLLLIKKRRRFDSTTSERS